MNKYQEALDFFIEIANSNEKLLINQEWLERYNRYLQQLVDRETPMKVIDHTKQLGGQHYCSKCNRVILYDEPIYCSNCGQKLERVQQ